MTETKWQFKPADFQRIIRAAEKAGLAVEIDLKAMNVSFVPVEMKPGEEQEASPRYGSEN